MPALPDPSDFPQHFDFDEWCRLAERNPRAYFRRRERMVAVFIASHPGHEPALRRLQDRIDGLRATAGSPQAALRGIMQLLEDHVVALKGHMLQLQNELQEMSAVRQEVLSDAPKCPPGRPPN